MNTQYVTPETVDRLRHAYPVGTGVILERMDDIQAPPAGTWGTVIGIDDAGTIHVNWDNGSTLGLIYGVDKARVLPFILNDKNKMTSEALYELYKAQWIKAHISFAAQMKVLTEYWNGRLSGELDVLSYDEYLEEYGFNGECFACFDEFCENELLDADYINGLIPDDAPELSAAYRELLGKEKGKEQVL